MFVKYLLVHFFTLSLIYRSVSGDGKFSSMKEEEFQIITKVNNSITLPCWPKEFPNKNTEVHWEKSGRRGIGEVVLFDGSLFIERLSRSDTKLFVCRQSEDDHIVAKVRLYVESPPDAPTNVTLNMTSSEAWVAWLQPSAAAWEREMGGGIPTSVEVQYKLAKSRSSPWKQLSPKSMSVSSSPRPSHAYIGGLLPNTSYEVEVGSRNKYGRGGGVTVVGVTGPGPGSSQVELSYRMLEGSKEGSPRAWLVTVVILLLVVNISGTVVLILYSKNSNMILTHNNRLSDDSEQIELVPNIIENPSYHSSSSSSEGGTLGHEVRYPILRPSNVSDASAPSQHHSHFV